MKNFKSGFLYGCFSMFVLVVVLFLIGAVKPWWAVKVSTIEKIRYVPMENELVCKDFVEESENGNNKLMYLGNYKLTAYCPCEKCCGKSDGITATGTNAKHGRTIAVDPSVIPYGSKLVIGDVEYIAEDCGGAIKGNRIDVYFESHEDALAFGVKFEDVYLVV